MTMFDEFRSIVERTLDEIMPKADERPSVRMTRSILRPR